MLVYQKIIRYYFIIIISDRQGTPHSRRLQEIPRAKDGQPAPSLQKKVTGVFENVVSNSQLSSQAIIWLFNIAMENHQF